MKAQSELAGDRKRQAETTCPRFGGVTKRMSTIKAAIEMEDSLAKHVPNLPEITIAPAFKEAFENIEIPKPEVKHRPAGQQWPVCTP